MGTVRPQPRRTYLRYLIGGSSEGKEITDFQRPVIDTSHVEDGWKLTDGEIDDAAKVVWELYYRVDFTPTKDHLVTCYMHSDLVEALAPRTHGGLRPTITQGPSPTGSSASRARYCGRAGRGPACVVHF